MNYGLLFILQNLPYNLLMPLMAILFLRVISFYSDGGGRSGVYLAIDANMELAEEEDCFHVFGFLKKLRQSRKGLIENVVSLATLFVIIQIITRSCRSICLQDQYKFVYDTLEEHIICGKTWFPVSELSVRLKAKGVKDPATKMNEYQREYSQICKQTPR